jgi:hypothetical protein
MRFLIWIYNLRINHPTEDICLSADDITAVFRRLLYHPDMAKLWATVFQEFLVIPCGMIFGGRKFMLLQCCHAQNLDAIGNYCWGRSMGVSYWFDIIVLTSHARNNKEEPEIQDPVAAASSS